MKLARADVTRIVEALLICDAHRATKYVNPKHIVRATRKLTGGKIDRRERNIEIVLTIGRPNYRERKFIKDCKKSGVKFPVRGVQMQYPRRR